jgi:hypothetical protein
MTPTPATAERLARALRAVQMLIVEGAVTGFNPKNGDWATRLYESNQDTSGALAAYLAEGGKL